MNKIERHITNTPPIPYLVDRSKRLFLPGFEGLPLYDVAVQFFKQVKKNGLSERAAAISFNIMVAIPAATIFLCTLIPYLPISKQIAKELQALTNDIFLNKNVNLVVHNFLQDFLNTQRGGLLSLGFLLVVFYASRAIMGITRSFNKSLTQVTKRNLLQRRWVAIQLTTVLISIVLLTVILLVTQGAIFKFVTHSLNIKRKSLLWPIKTFRWAAIVGLVYYTIGVIYKYAPAIQKRWKLASPGTILATSLTILTTLLFSIWVNKFNGFNKVYGSIGTILIIMMLIYFNSLVLLIGFELNVTIQALKEVMADKARVQKQAEV